MVDIGRTHGHRIQVFTRRLLGGRFRYGYGLEDLLATELVVAFARHQVAVQTWLDVVPEQLEHLHDKRLLVPSSVGLGVVQTALH